RGDELVEIGSLAGRVGAIAVEPALWIELILRALVGKHVVDGGVVAIGNRIGVLDALAAIDRVFIGVDFAGALGFDRLGLAGFGAVFALQQRVGQQLGIDEGIEFEMAQLQQ